MHYIKFHIKTLKIAPTCFDHKIIFRELHCSLLKSYYLKFDFSKEQYISLKMIFRIETCWSDFKRFNVKFYACALVGVIIIYQNLP